MLRYLWNAVFWLGFVLWYAAPPVTSVADYTGTPGAVMCVFGAAVAVAAALQVGMVSRSCTFWYTARPGRRSCPMHPLPSC